MNGPGDPRVPTDRTSLTDDERIGDVVPLPPPEHLIQFFPIRGTPVEALVAQTRGRVREILRGRSDRLLVVIGPCSIHDPAAALEYASRLAEVRIALEKIAVQRAAQRMNPQAVERTRRILERMERPGLSDFRLYKCGVCGKMVMGYEKESHMQEKHGWKSVEWRKVVGS